MTKRALIPWLLLFVLLGSLGCSVGTLIVRAPTPTRQPTRTPRPTFTFTPNWTPTRVPTLTPTPTQTPTETPIPTETVTPTPVPEEVFEPPEPAEPPPPQDTPTPEPPTATPTPPYPFATEVFVFDTQGALETRVTAYVVEVFDASTGHFKDLWDYQIVLIDPMGGEHLSNMSGGKNHTVGPGLGNDRWFNTEVKFSPYTPGHYKAWLVKDGVQQSPVVEFDMSPSPTQYVHIDFLLKH